MGRSTPLDERTSEARAYWIESLAAGIRFMQAATAHPLAECGESLVSIPEHAAAAGVPLICRESPHPAGRARDHRIRRSNIEPLLQVAVDLRERGLSLVIEDGLRSRDMQRELAVSDAAITSFAEVLEWVDPEAGDREIIERLGVIIAATPKTAGHVAGAAVDVSVLDSDGIELDRGGPYLELSERMPMDSPFVTAEQAAVRESITEVMAAHGFTAFPFEFWHYSRGDSLAAAALGTSEPAIYGPVDVAEDGSVSPVEDLNAPFSDPDTIVNAVRAALHRVGERAD